jgi:hypothetical protein
MRFLSATGTEIPLRSLAVIAGVVLLGLGIAGFMPALSPQGLLFGAFAANPSQNMFRIVTGILGILLGAAGEGVSVIYFRLVGIVYALSVVLGLFAGRSGEVMGLAVNAPGQVLHVAVAWIALHLGFFRPRGTRSRSHLA